MTDSTWKNQNIQTSLKNALAGCKYALTTQTNFKVHGLFSIIVILLALWLQIPFDHFLFLLIAISIGFTIEMANTVFETTVDLVTEEYNEKARLAKDISAGMMLIVSIGLALTGILILLPPLWQKIFSL